MRHPVIDRCIVCGGRELRATGVLCEELSSAWELSPEEVSYVDLQQGFHCAACRSTLRCMALAAALLRLFEVSAPFSHFVESDRARTLRLLEINEAGGLSPLLARLPGRTAAAYPHIDMQALPFPDRSFDIVVHSDTLEHVPLPLAGLKECLRVLRPGGACAFTVPIVVGRLSRSRAGMPASYHGEPGSGEHYLVHTEFGSDVWRLVLEAGFDECRLSGLELPAAHAIVAIR